MILGDGAQDSGGVEGAAATSVRSIRLRTAAMTASAPQVTAPPEHEPSTGG